MSSRINLNLGFEKLEDVTVLWSSKYSCPVYELSDGRLFVPMTGEYGGYFEAYKEPQPEPSSPTTPTVTTGAN